MNTPLAGRVIKHIDFAGQNGCWIWTGYILPEGYGQFNSADKAERDRAHRAAFKSFVGPIPPGAHVLHKCNNKRCVNPKHLYLGTDKDNCRDRINAGTQRLIKGRLSDEEVRFIRTTNLTQKELGANFQLSPSTISLIRQRKLYKHVI